MEAELHRLKVDPSLSGRDDDTNRERNMSLLENPSQEIQAMLLLKSTLAMLFGRRMFASHPLDVKAGKKKSHFLTLGLGPESMKEGDLICILFGCQLPVILRQKRNSKGALEDEYVYLGEAFLDGYMYGKAVEELEGTSSGVEKRSKVTKFEIQ
jgi:hypothetical protein